jgi:hypothetical protein
MENLEIMCRIAYSQNLVHTSEQHAVVVHRIITGEREGWIWEYASKRLVILESGVPVVGS